MSAPTPTRRPHADKLSVEHSSVYVSRRRGPKLPKPPHVNRPKLPPLSPRVRPFGIASAIAAGWAAVMGLIVVGVPVLLVWALAANTQSSAGDASVASADIWLASHHVGFFTDTAATGGGRFALMPLGLLVVPFVLLRLSTSWATRILRISALGDAGLLIAATSVIYGIIGGLVAAFAGRGPVHANPLEALLWCTVVALACTTWTVIRSAGLTEPALALLPSRCGVLLRPAAVGVATVLAGGAVLTLGSLVVHGGDAIAVNRALDGGVVGGLAVLILSLAYLPNLIIWASAFCIGPGFAVGAGTSVTVAGVASGPLPAFPLFAAIPSSGVPAAPVWLCLLVPLAGGILVARSFVGREGTLDPETTALWAGVAGAAAGLTLGLLAWLSGGPLGAGRLSVMGPSPWQVGALAALELGVVAAVAAWILGWRATARSGRAPRP